MNRLPKEKKKGLPSKFTGGPDRLPEQLEDIIGPLTTAAPSSIFRTSILVFLMKTLGGLAASSQTISNDSSR
jgi:hypothetical protein